MSSFFSKITTKAQSALEASPLAGRLPHSSSAPRPDSPDNAAQPAANQAAAQGGQKSHAFEALSYQFRNLQQQYSSSTSPAQKIITAEKGLVLDYDNVGREAKAQSKEVYTWGQAEPEDLKDVTDRIAYLNFVHGSLAAGLAQKLNAARAPLKALRDAETALQPRRAIRSNLEAQIAKVENDPKKAGDLREQLRRAEHEDAQAENEVHILKRKGLKESEQLKWTAIQEYAEKLLLLAQASNPILAELPAIPPTQNTPYNGFQRTGAVRAALQEALDNHRPGQTSFNLPSTGANLSRADTRSFGESHAAELSSIPSMPTPSTNTHRVEFAEAPVQQPVRAPSPSIVPSFPVATPGHASAPAAKDQSPPLNPANLNQAPAPIPAPVIASPPSSPEVGTAPGSEQPPTSTPTIAETGLPLSAGEAGPGPARGSLHDIKHTSPINPGALQSPPPVAVGSQESAEEEKRRLAALYSQPQTGAAAVSAPVSAPVPAAAPAAQHETAEEEKKRLAALYSSAGTAAAAAGEAPPAAQPVQQQQQQRHETAEEEKKRLEREERERILRGEGGQGPKPPRKDGENDEDLPPYQEPTW